MKDRSFDRSIGNKVRWINDDDDNEKRRMRYEFAGIIKNCKQPTYLSLSLSLSSFVSWERETCYLLAGGWTLQLLMFVSISAGLSIRGRVPRLLAQCIAYLVSRYHLLLFSTNVRIYIYICKAFDIFFTRRERRWIPQRRSWDLWILMRSLLEKFFFFLMIYNKCCKII